MPTIHDTAYPRLKSSVSEKDLQDLPCCGQVLRLRISARRFFCDNAACRRKVFAEQLPELMLPYARRAVRHNEALTTIGLAHGGEAGQRTAQALGFRVSADTLLRRVRAIPDQPVGEVRVLGVDDFALRRGRNYRTANGTASGDGAIILTRRNFS